MFVCGKSQRIFLHIFFAFQSTELSRTYFVCNVQHLLSILKRAVFLGSSSRFVLLCCPSWRGSALTDGHSDVGPPPQLLCSVPPSQCIGDTKSGKGPRWGSALPLREATKVTFRVGFRPGRPRQLPLENGHFQAPCTFGAGGGGRGLQHSPSQNSTAPLGRGSGMPCLLSPHPMASHCWHPTPCQRHVFFGASVFVEKLRRDL